MRLCIGLINRAGETRADYYRQPQRSGTGRGNGGQGNGGTDKQIKELRIEVTPLHPEAELRKSGVVFESSKKLRDFLTTHVTIDDEQRFVTGQNQNSGLDTAHEMMKLIAAKDGK